MHNFIVISSVFCVNVNTYEENKNFRIKSEINLPNNVGTVSFIQSLSNGEGRIYLELKLAKLFGPLLVKVCPIAILKKEYLCFSNSVNFIFCTRARGGNYIPKDFFLSKFTQS